MDGSHGSAFGSFIFQGGQEKHEEEYSKAIPYLNILAPQTEDYTQLIEKVKFLEENGKRKEMEIQKLRAQAAENVDLKQRIQSTEKKLGELERLIREALETAS